jgi:hypothetical protein
MMTIRRNGLKSCVRVLRARLPRIWDLVTNEQGIDLSAFGTKCHDEVAFRIDACQRLIRSTV